MIATASSGQAGREHAGTKCCGEGNAGPTTKVPQVGGGGSAQLAGRRKLTMPKEFGPAAIGPLDAEGLTRTDFGPRSAVLENLATAG
jgi:hypothetical protein